MDEGRLIEILSSKNMDDVLLGRGLFHQLPQNQREHIGQYLMNTSDFYVRSTVLYFMIYCRLEHSKKLNKHEYLEYNSNIGLTLDYYKTAPDIYLYFKL